MKDLIITMDRETFVSELRKKDDELNYLREKLLSLVRVTWMKYVGF